MPIKASYQQEVNEAIAGAAFSVPPIVTEQDLANLPEPVQRHLQVCGLVGRPRIDSVFIEYRKIFLKIWEGANFAPIQVYQFSSAEPELLRGIYLYNRIFGFISLVAKTWYRDGQSHPYARIMAIFPPSVGKGQDQNESALADLLGDMFLVPGMALSPLVQWVSINNTTARAIIRHGGLEVSGIFRFNADGECMEFDTEDRVYTMKDTTTLKVRSTMRFEAYKEVEGVRMPSALRAYWHLATGDFEYAHGEYGSFRFNPTEAVVLG